MPRLSLLVVGVCGAFLLLAVPAAAYEGIYTDTYGTGGRGYQQVGGPPRGGGFARSGYRGGDRGFLIRGDWGPFYIDTDVVLGWSGGVEWTDNKDLSEDNPEEELTFFGGPYISLGGGFGFDLGQAFTFSGGERITVSTSGSYWLEYDPYDDEYDQNFSSPVAASAIIPLLIYGWDVVLWDTFTFNNEPLETTWSFNEEDVMEYRNNAAISFYRRHRRYGISLLGERTDVWIPDEPLLEFTEYAVTLTPSYYPGEVYSFFLSGSARWGFPNDPTKRDRTSYSASAGVDGVITQNITGRASAGWGFTRLEPLTIQTANGPVRLPAEESDGLLVELSLNYASSLRPNTSHSLYAYHNPGVGAVVSRSEITQTTGVTYTITHRMSRRLVPQLAVSWVYQEDIEGRAPLEKVHIVSIGPSLYRDLGRHLRGEFSYRFQSRISNIDNQSYDVNTLRLIFWLTF